MPNAKIGRTGKCGNCMVPVKVVPFLCAEKRRRKNCATYRPTSGKMRDFNTTETRRFTYADNCAQVMYVLVLNKCIHPVRTHSTVWPFSKYIRYNNGIFSTKMKIALEVIVKLLINFSSLILNITVHFARTMDK